MAFKSNGIIVESIYIQEEECEVLLDALFEAIYNSEDCDYRTEWFDRITKLYSSVLAAKEAIVNERNKTI